jgi:hypothetical protein
MRSSTESAPAVERRAPVAGTAATVAPEVHYSAFERAGASSPAKVPRPGWPGPAGGPREPLLADPRSPLVPKRLAMLHAEGCGAAQGLMRSLELRGMRGEAPAGRLEAMVASRIATLEAFADQGTSEVHRIAKRHATDLAAQKAEWLLLRGFLAAAVRSRRVRGLAPDAQRVVGEIAKSPERTERALEVLQGHVSTDELRVFAKAVLDARGIEPAARTALARRISAPPAQAPVQDCSIRT